MPDEAPLTRRSPWVWPITLLLLALVVIGAGLWLAWQILRAPDRVLKEAGGVAEKVGAQAVEVARAFRTGQFRQEFSSRAVELTGTKKLQVATLKQFEVFQNEQGGTIVWDLVELPKVVVQAQAPVEYTYLIDLTSPWEFRHEDKKLTVIPPLPEPGTPAMDVSALKFYTLEGRLWPHESKVRDRLRESVTGRLARRAQTNVNLVREVARREVAVFVRNWLVEKFGDGSSYAVEVVFPDEVPAPLAEKPAP